MDRFHKMMQEHLPRWMLKCYPSERDAITIAKVTSRQVTYTSVESTDLEKYVAHLAVTIHHANAFPCQSYFWLPENPEHLEFIKILFNLGEEMPALTTNR